MYSARFGHPRSVAYPEKSALICRALRGRACTGHSASFVWALAHGGMPFETHATVEGSIAGEPRGRGDGYDPILLCPPLCRVPAELTAEAKDALSHRGRVVRALRVCLDARFTKP